MTFGESTSRKSSDFEYKVIGFGCGPWKWYKGVGKIHMKKGRVGEERKGKMRKQMDVPLHRVIYLDIESAHTVSRVLSLIYQ
jgi:hypothetical protein